MAKQSLWKKIERPVMLGIVLILLMSFAVIDAIPSCTAGGGGPTTLSLGGAFEASPGNSESLSDEEFSDRYRELTRYWSATGTNTVSLPLPVTPNDGDNAFATAWHHILASKAAEEAGFHVGTAERSNAISRLVSRSTSLRASDVAYQEFLSRRWRGRVDDFERLVSEMIRKDAFLAPVVDSGRYPVTYEEAFEEWKSQRERVNLEYIALSGDPFRAEVTAEEQTRRTIGTLEGDVAKVRSTANALGSLERQIEGWRTSNTEASWPADFAALVEAKALSRAPNPDAWGNELRFEPGEAQAFAVRSAGPDGKFETEDDLTSALVARFGTYGTFARMARAAHEIRAAKEAWPATAEDLRTPVTEGGLVPLTGGIQDAWGKDVVYQAGTGDAAPTLVSGGPDGAVGGGDDLTFTLRGEGDADGVVVPLATDLAGMLDALGQDAWERALEVGLEGSEPLRIVVRSAGPDGVMGSDDDVSGGNRQALEDFYASPSVRTKYRQEELRQFETLFIHLPLLPDDVFLKMWNAHPEFRPTSEEALFTSWRNNRTTLYTADDPADPETGYGAALAKEIAPDATPVLVPRRDMFPEDLDEAAKLRGVDVGTDDGSTEGEPNEPEDGGDEGEEKEGEDEDPIPDAPDPDAELRKTYKEQGWREIMIRQTFVESFMQDLMDRLVENQNAIRDWDEANTEEGAIGAAPRPDELSFESLLESSLNAYLLGAADADKGLRSFQYYRSKPGADDKPDGRWGDTRESWVENKDFGDNTFAAFLSGRTGEGEFIPSTIQVHRRNTKVLVRNLKFFPAQTPELDEVVDGVFEDYIGKRMVDRAVEVLAELREAGPKPTAVTDPEARDKQWQEALDAWATEHGHPYVREETGLFIGETPPAAVTVDEDARDEAAMRQRRLNFVWRLGYTSVRPSASAQDATTTAPGTFGRAPQTDSVAVEDGGTGMAYLVRVLEREWPTKSEFSPRLYSDFLFNKALGWKQGLPLGDQPATWLQAMHQHYIEEGKLSVFWRLRTNSPLNAVDQQR